MSSTYWSFRITLADRPGGLAEVARAVADLGVNILDLDVHLVESDDGRGSSVADDLVVELPYWVEPGLIELCLLRAGAHHVVGRRIDPHDLVDGHTRLLEAAAGLVRRGATDDDVVATLRSSLRCDVVWLGPARHLPPAGVARAALLGQSPVTGREWVKSLGSTGAAPWVAAVPWGEDRAWVAVLVRTHRRFTATEVARVQALLALVAAVRAHVVRSEVGPVG